MPATVTVKEAQAKLKDLLTVHPLREGNDVSLCQAANCSRRLQRARANATEKDRRLQQFATIQVGSGERLKDLIRTLMPGQEIIIAENRHPVAKLVSERGTDLARSAPGLGKGSIIYMACAAGGRSELVPGWRQQHGVWA